MTRVSFTPGNASGSRSKRKIPLGFIVSVIAPAVQNIIFSITELSIDPASFWIYTRETSSSLFLNGISFVSIRERRLSSLSIFSFFISHSSLSSFCTLIIGIESTILFHRASSYQYRFPTFS